jgi:hypothetical protein
MPADLLTPTDAPTPAAIGRAHALQRLCEHASDLADARPDSDAIPAADRAYLAAFRDTLRAIATRLRTSPGYEP